MVLLEGVRQMQFSGMQRAAVRTQVTNKPAIALYERVGFELVDYLYRYTKEVV